RVPPGDLARAVLATPLVFLLLCILSPTVVLPPFLLPALGLASVAAAGAAPRSRRAVPATSPASSRPGRPAPAHARLPLCWGAAPAVGGVGRGPGEPPPPRRAGRGGRHAALGDGPGRSGRRAVVSQPGLPGAAPCREQLLHRAALARRPGGAPGCAAGARLRR